MPRPKKGESKQAYVSRAIPIIADEHPELSRKARVGRAFGMYDSHKKKCRRRALTE